MSKTISRVRPFVMAMLAHIVAIRQSHVTYAHYKLTVNVRYKAAFLPESGNVLHSSYLLSWAKVLVTGQVDGQIWHYRDVIFTERNQRFTLFAAIIPNTKFVRNIRPT